MVNQVKLKLFCMVPCYKFGYEIPRDYTHAMELDCRNGNTKLRDAMTLELDQLVASYNTSQNKTKQLTFHDH